MYANYHHTKIRALEEARYEAARRAAPRPVRPELAPGAVRLAVGKMLIRAGTRLAPDTVSVTPVAGTPC
ncbi:MAG: hypothetical protein KJ698_00750 [Actinobacteria bacterium]|nr:hypothetical protein [Actinomycetota bacterium]MBU1493601.1 hypothetical protein [Actinomycetota bacterium]MBU1864805.1 hypothetical protein [Actinomycetota bacterium]